MKKRTLVSWSSGKDSAWTLHVLRQDPAVDVVGLFSTVNQNYDRVAMHATRLELLHRQAEAVSLPVEVLKLPDPCSNEQYEAIMRRFIQQAVARGIECIAFGDLFLEDIRQYRENHLRGTGITPLFPLWKRPTPQLAEQMLAAGLKAFICTVDLKKLPAHCAGREWSNDFLRELPKDVDPCGENGEFHTVVVGGPLFHEPIPVKVGQIVERSGYAYADITVEH